MKRSKKRNEAAPGQLCLFELPVIRQQEEETRRAKPKKKPVAPSKFAALTLMPPAPEPALKQPENALQTKIPDREELNRLWKANPEALHTLKRMKEINPAVRTLVCRLTLFSPLPAISVFLQNAGTPCRSGGERVSSGRKHSPPAPTLKQPVSFLVLAEKGHDPPKQAAHAFWGYCCPQDAAHVNTPGLPADNLHFLI